MSNKKLTRRDALKIGACAAVGATGLLSVSSILTSAKADEKKKSNAPAKAVIEIWLGGGASQLETFDPKPKAGKIYTGPITDSIKTSVHGMEICSLMPNLAKHAEKYSLIRSLTHGVFAHETAAYRMQTGREQGGNTVFPSIGSIVSFFQGYNAGYDDLIPPLISLTKAKGRFTEAGYLGPKYKSFATGGNPARHPFYVDGIIAKGVSDSRQQRRRELLADLNALGDLSQAKQQLAFVEMQQRKAYELILGKERKLFDLRTENSATRRRYGMNTFGQSCLMARRLVQRSVKYVTVNFGGWDTHKRHFESIRGKTRNLDVGLSALIEDLANRDMLDSTVVWCSGEFGRTPKIMWESPWNGGRGHFGNCFSGLVAGGGFEGGKIIGASNYNTSEVIERPVLPQDLLGSILMCMGIDPEADMPLALSETLQVMPEKIGDVKSKGRLLEIMPFARNA